MSRETLYQKNVAKIRELQEEKQWAAEMWLSECDRLGYVFRIEEAFRTQERQNKLFAQGRTRSGPIVTWTLQSKHTQRLALDVYPQNCTHAEIASVARKYGITHPIVSDPPHYEFDKAVAQPKPRPRTPQEAVRIIIRKLKTETNPRNRERLLLALTEEQAKI